MSKYIFLDRDGTIIVDKPYICDPKEIEFLPGAIEGLKKIQNEEYKFIVISNQSGVARKFYRIQDVNIFNDILKDKLAENGIKIEKIYYCPHHPEFTGSCDCRKPNTGLALKAAEEYHIDLENSYYVGDKDCDIELGKNCGGKTCLINNGQYQTSSKPDFTVSNLDELAEIIKNPHTHA